MSTGVVALCVAATVVAAMAGCSSSDDAMQPRSVSSSTTLSESTPTVNPLPPLLPPTSTMTIVNADAFAIAGDKHAFRLESTPAGCWFNLNTADPNPHMLCDLPLRATDPPIMDPLTGIWAPANAVVIDAAGARTAVNAAGAVLTGPVLSPGSVLVVGPLRCSADSEVGLTCSGPGGSFTFSAEESAVVVDDRGATETATGTARPIPEPRLAARVGESCGEVGNRIGGSSPVIVLKGEVDCDVALRVADRYMNDPTVDAQGQGRFAIVDGWNCSWPYVEGRSHAESYLHCSDDPITPANSFKIGE